MNRSISPVVLAGALIAFAASGFAQTPPPAQPPTTQPQPAQPPTAQPPATPPTTQAPTTQPPSTQHPAEHDAAGTPAEHLAKAKAALNEIQMTSVTGAARTALTELKHHVAALDRYAAAGPAANAPTTTPASSRANAAPKNWATEVAAIDRLLTELTTPTTSAAEPSATTGATGTTGTTRRGRTAGTSAVTIDDTTRAKLLEVRQHITAFAAAMSGTAAPAAPSNEAAAAPTAPPATQPPTTEPPATQPPANPPSTTPPATTTPPSTAQEPGAAAATAKVDKEAARRHLTEARDILSQLTQLPEAAQLTGDARTQVSELIANFNELITTQTDWRASFDKVQANLTALIGAERTDEANVQPPATGTAGAVGTSGMTTLDPKVRGKLVEFRAKLATFQKAIEGK